MNNNSASVVVNIYNGTGSVFSVDLSTFGKSKVTFGNSPANDVFISSSVVSEYHGYFQLTNIGWIIVDNHSKNGIVANGKKTADAQLVNGMEIRIVDDGNKSIPAVTMFIDIAGDLNNDAGTFTNADISSDEPQPKKKRKAPIIIAIVLVVVLGMGGFVVVALGLLGFGVYNYIKPSQMVPDIDNVQIEDYTEALTGSEEENETENPTENATENESQVPVELPARVPSEEDCKQFVLAECNGTYASLVFYEKENGVWVEKLTADGRIGKNGITQNKREGDGCTPAGEFNLTFCCGLSDPGTNMDFQIIDSRSVWVDDVDSRYYNTLQDADLYYRDWDSAEPMYESYFKNNRHNYCINIAANGDGISDDEVVAGGGSVITLCGKNDTLKETQGCIDISGEDMLDFLSYLDSEKRPVIIIY